MGRFLKIGQVVIISGTEYTVTGIIGFKEDNWKWEEYRIVNKYNKVLWLNVEEDEGKTVYSVYEDFKGSINMYDKEFTKNNEKYTLYEKGRATVISCVGAVDIDYHESCEYFEFINEKQDTIISIEDWDGDIEKSIGKILKEEDIHIEEKVSTSYNNFEEDAIKNSKENSISKFISIGIVLMIILPIMYQLIASIGLFENKSIQKYLEKDSNFTYVTSVTNNTNNQKAKVYQSSMTVDETVKNIIQGVPEGITKTVKEDDDTNNGIGLFTKKEYAYVYTSEDSSTYVQVSNREYVNSSSTVYRSRYRGAAYHYYRTYSSNKIDSTYTSYLNSVRQSSVRARTSSGGGTSAGK